MTSSKLLYGTVIIRGAIQTDLFAGIFSIGDLIASIAVPSTNLYGMFAIPIGRICMNVSDLDEDAVLPFI